MPLELIDMVKGFHPPSSEDRGFLINLTRAQWNNSATTEAMNLLRSYAEPYYEMKCPESNESPTKEGGDESESQSKDDASSNRNKALKKSYCIQFAVRELHNNIYCFVACNLADPEDFTHFIFSKLAEESNDLPKPKLQFRILPVQRICEAKSRIIEQTLLPLLEQTLAKDSYPHRFSLVNRSSFGGEGISFSEAMSLARNCVWAANPNCVQCLKYQDYAVVMNFIGPLFYVGVVREFQRLASYNTLVIRRGVDDRDQKPDSEDDISDDPTLSEEEDRRRKLRIKRKRRAEQLNMSKEVNEAKKQSQEAEGDNQAKVHDEEDDDDGEGEDYNLETLNGDGKH